MKKAACALLFFLASMPAWADEHQADTTLFLQANQAYKSADFAGAAALYENLLAAGLRNGDLYYNLGNAYLKKGDLGRALVNFRQAEKFKPRDADLAANLHYALEQTRDKIDCSESASVWKAFFFWLPMLSCRELCWIFLGCNLMLWLFAAARFILGRESFGLAVWVALFLTVLSGASFGMKYNQDAFVMRGVVVSREILVRAGNSQSDTVLFKLHEGTEFSIVDQESAWVKISLCDGKKGWAQKASIGIVPNA